MFSLANLSSSVYGNWDDYTRFPLPLTAGDEERKKHSIEYRKNYRAINKVRIQQYMFAYNFKKKQERENISIQIVEPNENIL